MPGVKTLIPIAKPVLDQADADAAARAILSGWVTQGPEVAAFEREFAAAVGAPHACAVSSGTTALHAALLAVGVQPGDEVITASHSFIATANAIRYCGARPVFVDVHPDTYNMDPAIVDRAVGPKTRAILAVHQVGLPCDLDRMLEIARRRSVALVEDAACAIGSDVRVGGEWARVGRPHGDAACFSFHPRKLVTTGDGGMVTTRSADIDARVRALRHHGMSVSDLARHASDRVTFETYPTLGFNFRMTDVQAAIGRVQLSRLPAMQARRRALAARYGALLASIPGLGLPFVPDDARPNWQTYTVRLPEGRDQRTVMQAMLDAGVATRRGVMCAHREAAYPRSSWSCGADRSCDARSGPCPHLRHSEAAQDRTIAIPLFDAMTDDDVDRVARALETSLGVGGPER
ncbi:MAG: DegT/DnrJ/EryC1/StrS family aminotransferase [Acidobacteriia bacterium]|nr:DegT/DnrJ/EryC1/StrS family aminotransferase [Terriglobia bacterium]